MWNDTKEDCLLIEGNSTYWSEQEKEEIVNRAVKNYVEQKTKIVDATKESVLASHIDQSENNDSLFVFPSSDDYSGIDVYSE